MIVGDLKYSKLTLDDIYIATRSRFDCDIVDGVTCRDDIRILGVAGVSFGPGGLAWGFMDIRGELKSPFIFRKAVRFLSSLPRPMVIYTLCDENFNGAARFLRRLGFLPQNMVLNDRTVWRIDLTGD